MFVVILIHDIEICIILEEIYLNLLKYNIYKITYGWLCIILYFRYIFEM